MSKASPLQAIEELIWNGLDAGGSKAEFKLTMSLSGMGNVQTVEVTDYGTGIPPEEVEAAFGQIGASRKPKLKENADGRAFHGKEGTPQGVGDLLAARVGHHLP